MSSISAIKFSTDATHHIFNERIRGTSVVNLCLFCKNPTTPGWVSDLLTPGTKLLGLRLGNVSQKAKTLGPPDVGGVGPVPNRGLLLPADLPLRRLRQQNDRPLTRTRVNGRT